MKITSYVYPTIEINEQVVLDLINSRPLQRLKKIYAASYNFVAGNKRDNTRYEHSIGVLQLLRIYNASLDEQIAGLLHDVAHTAFSHLSTYALEEEYDGEEYHEVIKKEFITNTEIPKILKNHNFDVDYITNEKSFSMLENSLPNICADRIDYTLRDSIIWQILSKDEINEILNNLIVLKGSFIFSDVDAALNFSTAFYTLNQTMYGSAYNAYFNHKFGNMVKEAMKKGILDNNDWFKTDYDVIYKLKESKDTDVLKTLNLFDGRLVIYEDNENPEFTFSKKLRVVDPLVLVDGKPKRLSNINDCYKTKIETYKKTHKEHKLNISTYLREVSKF